MATTDEILLTINAKDNASSTASQIDGSFKSMASGIQSAMANMNSGLMNLSTGMNNILGGITGGKNAGDIIFGTASKAETNKVLLSMMTETEGAAKSLYNTVDKVTDSSLTSMQELIPAMNAFKAATGASDNELENVTDEMANFGAAVLAQTGSTERAQTAMMDLSKGIKGAFASLDQYGVSEDALKRTGLWNGKEDDVEGYMAAVEKVIGSTDKLMETNQGLDALIGKSFSRAGKKIGNEFLPFIKDIKKGFIDLDNELGGGLAAGILVATEGIDALSQGLFTASTMINGVQDIAGAFHDVRDAIKGASNAAEGFGDAMNIASNASDMAGLAGVAGAAGSGAEFAKKAGKGEKAAELGLDSLAVADLLKDTSKGNKDSKKLLKELAESGALQEEIGKLSKGNDTAKKKAGKLLKESLDYDGVFDTKLLKEWEVSQVTFTGLLKSKFGSLKSGFSSAFSSLQGFISEGFGAKLQNMLFKGFGGLGEGIRAVSGKFKGITSTLSGLNFGDVKTALITPFTKLADGVKGLPSMIKGIGSSINSGLGQAISGFNFKDAFTGLKDKLGGLKGAKEAASEVKTVTKGVEEVGAAASAAGAAAPSMEAGAAGAGATAAATTSLSAAFTSMIVPALALAAVVAIMIPIVAALAAEAMIFIKALGDFMQSLHFENIDLKGSIEGLKQIATGLAYVAAAMAAMTFTSILTGIAFITSGFTGITAPLKVAKNAIMEAAEELKSFGDVKLDPSIASNLKTVSDSLSAVANAMASMAWTNITTGFTNFISGIAGFSSAAAGIGKAKDEIMAAATKLKEFAGMDVLDKGVADNIQNVCNSLKSVGDAMGALRSIRDGQNWDAIFGSLANGLFGGSGANIQTALNSVKVDIQNAATALSTWTVPDVPQDIGSRISKVSDALNGVKSGLESLKSVAQTYDGGFVGWVEGGLFGGADIQGSIDRAITEINGVANKLAGIQSVTIPDLSFITRISVGLSYLKQAGMQLAQFGGFVIPPEVATNVQLAVQSVSNIASQLTGMSETNVGDVNGLLTSINTALTNLRATLANAAGGFAAPATGIGTSIVSGVRSGLSGLGAAVTGAVTSGMSAANGAATNGGRTLGTNATNAFRGSLKLADVAREEMGHAVDAVNSGSGALADACRRAAEQAVAAAQSGINAGSPGDIARLFGKEVGVYSPQKIYEGAGSLINAARSVSSDVVGAFGEPDLGFTTSYTPAQLDSMNTLTSTPQTSTTNNTNTTIIFQEGSMPIDARNMTEYEAKQWLILALESLGLNINIRGAK